MGRLANYKYFNMYQSILNALEPFDSNAPKAAVFQVFKLDSGGPDWVPVTNDSRISILDAF